MLLTYSFLKVIIVSMSPTKQSKFEALGYGTVHSQDLVEKCELFQASSSSFEAVL